MARLIYKQNDSSLLPQNLAQLYNSQDTSLNSLTTLKYSSWVFPFSDILGAQQNTERFPVHAMGVLGRKKCRGPCWTLKLYSKYFLSYYFF